MARLCISPSSIEANPRAILAIEQADAIIVGPGNFFSSLLPIFLVPGLKDAVKRSHAKKIYVANLFTQKGHTDTLTLPDFLRVFTQYIGEDIFTHVLYNSRAIPASGTAVQIPKAVRSDKRFIGRALANMTARQISASDPIAKMRARFLHDAGKLGKAIAQLL